MNVCVCVGVETEGGEELSILRQRERHVQRPGS